jgi:hypothetical protein
MPHKTIAAEGKSAAEQKDAGVASVNSCQYTTPFDVVFLCDGSVVAVC